MVYMHNDVSTKPNHQTSVGSNVKGTKHSKRAHQKDVHQDSPIRGKRSYDNKEKQKAISIESTQEDYKIQRKNHYKRGSRLLILVSRQEQSDKRIQIHQGQVFLGK